jgi:hypothetical protein
VAWEVEHLPGKHKALSSNPDSIKEKGKRRILMTKMEKS